jgi:hypothetical protein
MGARVAAVGDLWSDMHEVSLTSAIDMLRRVFPAPEGE